MFLNQYRSADYLGLNPAGLTKWEKHHKSVKKLQLSVGFLFQGNVLFEQSSHGLSCPPEEVSYRVFGAKDVP